MKKKKKYDKADILVGMIKVLLWLILIAWLAVTIYVFVKYGSMPITEVPSWAIPFMISK